MPDVVPTPAMTIAVPLVAVQLPPVHGRLFHSLWMYSTAAADIIVPFSKPDVV